jgi:hypothetical protein
MLPHYYPPPDNDDVVDNKGRNDNYGSPYKSRNGDIAR